VSEYGKLRRRLLQVLVAYGSKRGGTAGLAAMIGGSLEAAGVTADVRLAAKVDSLDGYNAVIVGGALYAAHWHRDARRFVRQWAAELSGRPVWLFSSGPLDDSASQRDIPPVAQVRKAMELCHARDHATFGGRLAPYARGFPAAAMAKKNPRDWRDEAQVTRWVNALLPQLTGEARLPRPNRPEAALHRPPDVSGLSSFSASAFFRQQ
jgi:menaquinone-dependent protoporphyrinogen oxidase